MPSPPSKSLPEQLATQAEFIVNNLEQTDYQHKDHIETDKGIYDCDCNGFVAFVLKGVAPKHYAMVPEEPHQPRPRAFEYYVFFTAPTLEANGGWRRIHTLQDARRGDILAWRFSDVVAGHDTGHVVFVAETPKVLDSGALAVRVYDSAASAHFDDTRGDAAEFPSGVGSGFINFEVNSEGAPIAFQFGPSDQRFHHFPIAVGRIEPL